ncbi:SRGAP1 [Cordylochernes scorpioides]|uniref:SRGAP1 n=1 Tax=Cordylochernes scorpioides TaxID=51811 RepID=A0ABY6L2R6_9ARAC|nr:SRGAP1 [Cordylochernes scorpioides]
MLSTLRQKYWILRVKDQVKRCIRECVTCCRYNRVTPGQLMSDLPKERLTPGKPFSISGVDHAGPVNLRLSKGRGQKTEKGYICLFVCFVTRAVHLELVTDASTPTFMSAFKRFVARRGHCTRLYSDQGTSFVGAARQLRSRFYLAQDQLKELAAVLANDGTKWKTISPNVDINTLVLIKEERMPPAGWLMGRVVETHPGKDGLVRVVSVRTSVGVLRRPLVWLVLLPLRADRQETEDFYLHKFQEYLQANSLSTRLRARAGLLRTALGLDSAGQSSAGSSPARPHRALRLHHQGVFRVSGSQVEINNFKEAFEKGMDPLADMTDASDINSVAGVLKLYLRELREPLFPIFYFDQLVEISQVESKPEFIAKVRDLVNSLPRSVYIVLRYLFAFLNHLSEFSDENMMDPYNLAICLGPTLLPIPEDKDQVQFQNLVNELVKNLIVFQEDIFDVSAGGPLYEKYLTAHSPIEPEVGECPTAALEQASSDCDDEAEGLEAVAQYDFSARSDRELSFRRGDTLQLHSQVSGDWWRGSLAGRDGLVPDKYILLKIRTRCGLVDKAQFGLDIIITSHKSCSTSCIPEEEDSTPLRRSGSPLDTNKHHRRRSLSPSSLRAAATVWTEPCSSGTVLPQPPPRNCKDTPDLVLDLPISPSGDSPPVKSPTTDSPEMTGAERFALSNQCTMKKGSTMARRMRQNRNSAAASNEDLPPATEE